MSLIIGIDFGHGEISANYMEGDQIRPLILDPELKQSTLIAAIAYKKDDKGNVKTLIGERAARQPNVIAYFKRSPLHWEEKVEGYPAKKLMSDFFAQLMTQIRAANEDSGILPQDSQDILLMVGCPTSSEWLDRKPKEEYRDLIVQATGVPNVKIVPESRAAIFSVFDQSAKLTIDANQGVAVFDFGSSTADFTYMLLGKKMMEHSWTLGAAQIEQTLLMNTLEQNNALHRINLDNLKVQELDVRKYKEDYFISIAEGADYEKTLILDIQEIGRDGKPIQTGISAAGNPKYKKIQIPVRVNDDTIENCVKNYSVGSIFENNQPVGNFSWYEACERFFTTMRTRLQAAGCPCKTIVLTGGASKMYFVRQLCNKIFPDATICAQANPSYSVSVGLCYLGKSVDLLPRLIEERKAELAETTQKAIKQSIAGISEEIAEVYCNAVLDSLKTCSGTMTVRQLTEKLSADAKQAVPATQPIQISENRLRKLAAELGKAAQKHAKETVAAVYPGLTGSLQAQFHSQKMDELTSNLQFNLDVGKVLNQLNLTGFISNMITTVLVVIVGIVLAMIPGVNIILFVLGSLAIGVVYDIVSNWVNSHPGFEIRRTERLAQNFQSRFDRNKTDLAASIAIELAAAFEKEDAFGTDFKDYVDSICDVSRALTETMALKRFEN